MNWTLASREERMGMWVKRSRLTLLVTLAAQSLTHSSTLLRRGWGEAQDRRSSSLVWVITTSSVNGNQRSCWAVELRLTRLQVSRSSLTELR